MIKELQSYIDLRFNASLAKIKSRGNLQAIIDTAKKEIGVREIFGIQNNKKIVEYHKFTSLKASNDEVPWCSSFANYVVSKCGMTGTNSALAKSWLKWGYPALELDNVKFKDISGAVLVFKRGSNPAYGHVGFLHSVDKSLLNVTLQEFKKNKLKLSKSVVYTLGGNQSNSVSIAPFDTSSLIDIRIDPLSYSFFIEH